MLFGLSKRQKHTDEVERRATDLLWHTPLPRLLEALKIRLVEELGVELEVDNASKIIAHSRWPGQLVVSLGNLPASSGQLTLRLDPYNQVVVVTIARQSNREQPSVTTSVHWDRDYQLDEGSYEAVLEAITNARFQAASSCYR